MTEPELLAPVHATRRARREAERAAEALVAAEIPEVIDRAAESSSAHDVERDFEHAAMPAFLLAPVPARHVAAGRAASRPSPAPRRRGATLTRVVLSGGAMLSVVGLAVGLSVPAAATFGAPAPLESATESIAATTVPAAVIAQPPAQSVSFDFGQPVAMDLRSAVSGTRAEATFASESKAEVLRALYLSAGRPFEPGFIPTTGSVRWPFPVSVEISSGFGERDIGYHAGTDFVPGYGTPVGAIADGVVTWVGRDRTNFGYYVTIAHVIDGVRVDSLYAHLVDDSSAAYGLYPGLEVKVGALIGDTGNTGFSTGPHLHLEIHLEGEPVNPYEWLTLNAR